MTTALIKTRSDHRKLMALITPVAVTISTTTLPNGKVSTAYNQTVAATGGKGTLKFSATGLPAGLSISSGGVITGSPTTAGANPNVKVTAADDFSNSTTKTFALTIDP